MINSMVFQRTKLASLVTFALLSAYSVSSVSYAATPVPGASPSAAPNSAASPSPSPLGAATEASAEASEIASVVISAATGSYRPDEFAKGTASAVAPTQASLQATQPQSQTECGRFHLSKTNYWSVSQ